MYNKTLEDYFCHKNIFKHFEIEVYYLYFIKLQKKLSFYFKDVKEDLFLIFIILLFILDMTALRCFWLNIVKKF